MTCGSIVSNVAGLNQTAARYRSHLVSPLHIVILCWILVVVLSACAPSPPSSGSGLQAVTAVPTLDTSDPEALCAGVAELWGRDWLTTIRALEALNELVATCADDLLIESRLYQAYLAYGTVLEQRGREEEAVQAYSSAIRHNPVGEEAATRLQRLGIYTPQPPDRCEPEAVMQALESLSDYTPTEGNFVRIDGQQFTLEGEAFPIYGLNYYPRDTPWEHFLTDTDVASIGLELDLFAAAGLNTLRIFVRYDNLFVCPGNGAVPVAENFARLDGIIQEAAGRGFRLMVVLNDTPDLTIYPLYHDPEHIADQTTFIVTRYRNEPAILAWDLRDAGDLDYYPADESNAVFEREVVLTWLTQTAIAIRQIDSEHLITASWRDDITATIPAVDFVSFQHFGELESLRQKIASLRSQTDKPILLSAVGYSTYEGLNEIAQRDILHQTFGAAANDNLTGWLVWTAFDFPLNVVCNTEDCSGKDSTAYHYGIWTTSYFPKLALDAIKHATGSE
jgi:tetratricopeptide (TPR) repeat protein